MPIERYKGHILHFMLIYFSMFLSIIKSYANLRMHFGSDSTKYFDNIAPEHIPNWFTAFLLFRGAPIKTMTRQGHNTSTMFRRSANFISCFQFLCLSFIIASGNGGMTSPFLVLEKYLFKNLSLTIGSVLFPHCITE